MARVRHHLIGEIPLSQSFDVGQYRALALRRLDEIKARGKSALVVGGTGMYLRALSRGLADIPPADPEIRAQLDAQPLEDLLKQLEKADPVASGQVDLKNRRRVVRALEVCILTGQPFSQFQGDWAESCSDLHGVLLNRERTELYSRINERVEWMFESGVLSEPSAAGPIGSTASQTLGLREIQAVVRGELDQAEALLLIQQATRRYAKRQATWFRREPWLTPVDLSTLPTLESQVATVIRALRKSPLK
jgi:tRNA dimethylallyltransferase